MDERWPVRRRIRLDRDAYSQPDTTWLLSIAVKDRGARPFADPSIASGILGSIDETAEGRLEVFVVVVMPDHIHALVTVMGGNLIDHVSAIKSATTRVWWKHGGSGVLWQRSFHDRGIRNPRIFEQALEYVVHNPVEAGLVSRWSDYPFIAGSMIESET